ncbi:alpha-amylase family glycosyl hydrolase [Algivirga pacifica]|uniref:Alpha-amylase family glycosyl hydrolase n=1 Tax=Algivirga pacifica TaxID=1162670 RepID=A0ABP9D471_9BACT
MTILQKISHYFQQQADQDEREYYIPSLWDGVEGACRPLKKNPSRWYADLIDRILHQQQEGKDYQQPLSLLHHSEISGGNWTMHSRFYNLFPRMTTSYDHDQDGHVGIATHDTTLSLNGFRETGTFLKSIALLPYLHSLGIDTVYCLPITSIGEDGNRGDLGSPYAIKNQYKLDQFLADPLLPDFSVEEQFQAFVEAAHSMGMRVIVEFVLRTSSLGGDWVKEHPEWYYWIDASRVEEYSSPAFLQKELDEIKLIPHGKGTYHMPDLKFRSLFKAPPQPEEIKVEQGKYVAYTEEGRLVIPGAFADWPPDDPQPAWSDVTYLRMYNYPIDNTRNDYNYIAYNTIRYYDPKLAKEKNVNRPLWDKLSGVIPYYQETFGIDGVMMDMGHAMPAALMEEIITKARHINPDFAFCEENFHLTTSSKEAGFNAALGHVWRDSGKEGGLQYIAKECTRPLALPFYGTPETHNTPRAVQRGGLPHAKCSYVVCSFLPHTIPFIHQGFELGENWPINTGLNFTPAETDFFSKQRLPLFYKSALKWNTGEHLLPFIKHVNMTRNLLDKELPSIDGHFIANNRAESIRLLDPHGGFGHILAFERIDPKHKAERILVVANTNFTHSEEFYLEVDGTHHNSFYDYMSGKQYTFVNSWFSSRLEPGEAIVMRIG